MMEESAGQIDLVLSDVMMPEMNGPALIERLLVDRPDLKVVYMSGFTADLIREKGELHQRHPFLQKPFSIATLTAAVQSALAEK
jgi:two-component system cell cycle sensor histidine kinase/response regulator CckA